MRAAAPEPLEHDSGNRRVHEIDRERDRHLPEHGADLRGADLPEDLVGRLDCHGEKPRIYRLSRAQEECGSGCGARGQAL